jgi:hypothetical protein
VGWVVLGVWIGAVVIALLVAGFCAYELSTKARRLRGALARLTPLAESLAAMQAKLDRPVLSAPSTSER